MNIIKYYMETEAKNKETHMKKKVAKSGVLSCITHLLKIIIE